MKYLAYKDQLQAKGLRISHNLTLIQRHEIKAFRAQCFNAYFKNGNLYNNPMSEHKAFIKKHFSDVQIAINRVLIRKT